MRLAEHVQYLGGLDVGGEVELPRRLSKLALRTLLTRHLAINKDTCHGAIHMVSTKSRLPDMGQPLTEDLAHAMRCCCVEGHIA